MSDVVPVDGLRRRSGRRSLRMGAHDGRHAGFSPFRSAGSPAFRGLTRCDAVRGGAVVEAARPLSAAPQDESCQAVVAQLRSLMPAGMVHATTSHAEGHPQSVRRTVGGQGAVRRSKGPDAQRRGEHAVHAKDCRLCRPQRSCASPPYALSPVRPRSVSGEGGG